MNPRTPHDVNGFQDRRIKPLCHPSAGHNMRKELWRQGAVVMQQAIVRWGVYHHSLIQLSGFSLSTRQNRTARVARSKKQIVLSCAFHAPHKQSGAAAAVCADGWNKPILFAARRRVFCRRACTPVLAQGKKGGNAAADKRAVPSARANNKTQCAKRGILNSAS